MISNRTKASWHLLLLLLLASDPEGNAASTLYLGTDRGPYRSTDSGATWKQIFATVTDPALQGLPKVVAIVVDPLNPSNVYASANFGSPNAFLRSSDAGQTWTTKAQPGFRFTAPLVIDPVQTNVLYSTSNSVTPPPPGQNADPVMRSTDAGLTWSPLNLPNPTVRTCGGTSRGPKISSLATDPNNSGVLYAIGPGQGECGSGGAGYIFKSTDYGNTWGILTEGQEFGGRLFVDPHNSQVLYASGNASSFPQCSSTNGGQCGLYRSSDGGKTWTDLPLPSAAVRNLTLDATQGVLYAVIPFNLISLRLMKSVDAGNTWTLLDPGPLVSSAVPIGGLAADPGAPLTVYVTSLESINRLILKTTDGGATWTSIRVPQACDPPSAAICAWSPNILALAVAPPAPALPPPPAITPNGVVNGASLQTGVIANSWVTIFGTNLAPATLNWDNLIANGKLPTSLGGVSVSIGGKPAYVYFVSQGQINVLAPDVPPGPVSVTVTVAGRTSAVLTTTASQYGPAFFVWPGNQPVATRQDFTFAAKADSLPGVTTVPAKPGDVIILWGTGFGPTNPAAPTGQQTPSDQIYATTTLPAVTINGSPVTVYGAALAPGFAGLYQVAIQVPDSLADGDWPVQVSIGGVQSPGGIRLSVRR